MLKLIVKLLPWSLSKYILRSKYCMPWRVSVLEKAIEHMGFFLCNTLYESIVESLKLSSSKADNLAYKDIRFIFKMNQTEAAEEFGASKTNSVWWPIGDPNRKKYTKHLLLMELGFPKKEN